MRGRARDRGSEREGQREGVSKWPPRVGITLSFINHFLRFTRRRRACQLLAPFNTICLSLSLSLLLCLCLSLFQIVLCIEPTKAPRGRRRRGKSLTMPAGVISHSLRLLRWKACVLVLCVCVCECAKGCACVLCLGIGWNSTRFLPCRAWQIKNIADRSKNFHTHLFLFTARNLHIKAEQKDDTARYPFNPHTLPLLSDTSVALRVYVCVRERVLKSLTLTQVKISKNYAWL